MLSLKRQAACVRQKALSELAAEVLEHGGKIFSDDVRLRGDRNKLDAQLLLYLRGNLLELARTQSGGVFDKGGGRYQGSVCHLLNHSLTGIEAGTPRSGERDEH